MTEKEGNITELNFCITCNVYVSKSLRVCVKWLCVLISPTARLRHWSRDWFLPGFTALFLISLKKDTNMIVKMTHTYNYKVPHSHNNKIQTKYTMIVLPFNYYCVQHIISRHSGAFRSWLYSLCKILRMSTSKCRDTSLPYKLKASIFYVKFLFLCKTKTTPEGLTRKKNIQHSQHY